MPMRPCCGCERWRSCRDGPLRTSRSTWSSESCASMPGTPMTDERSVGPAGREGAIIDTFVRLADTLVDSYDVIDFLQYLCERCVELVAVDEAGVLLVAPTGNLQAVAASSERT